MIVLIEDKNKDKERIEELIIPNTFGKKSNYCHKVSFSKTFQTKLGADSPGKWYPRLSPRHTWRRRKRGRREPRRRESVARWWRARYLAQPH